MVTAAFKNLFSGMITSLAIVFASPVMPEAAELIMMEQKSCPWCERWHEEIGTIYNKTAEGKRAPLRIVNIHGPIPEDLKNIPMERFTPTFVLIEDGKEIDRLRGYTGDEFFWFLLNEMLSKLPEEQS